MAGPTSPLSVDRNHDPTLPMFADWHQCHNMYTEPYVDRQHDYFKRNLLYSLRSRMHPAKVNFRKIHLNNLECTYGCQVIEDQRQLFQSCEKLVSKDKLDLYDYIFKDAVK